MRINKYIVFKSHSLVQYRAVTDVWMHSLVHNSSKGKTTNTGACLRVYTQHVLALTAQHHIVYNIYGITAQCSLPSRERQTHSLLHNSDQGWETNSGARLSKAYSTENNTAHNKEYSTENIKACSKAYHKACNKASNSEGSTSYSTSYYTLAIA